MEESLRRFLKTIQEQCYTSSTSLSEVYNEKLRLANAILNGEDGDFSFIESEAKLRGVSTEDLCLLILEKKKLTEDSLKELELVRTKLNLATRKGPIDNETYRSLNSEISEIWRKFNSLG